MTKVAAAAAVLALGLGATACSSDDDGATATSAAESSSTTAAATPSGSGTSTPDATTGEDGAASAGVSAMPSTLGEVLVLDGLPLYVFDRDTAESSSCLDTCADAWPAVPADAEVAADLDLTTGAIERPDGTSQLTIDGSPVYTFAADDPLTADGAGEPFGQGTNDVWWVVAADGSPMREVPSN